MPRIAYLDCHSGISGDMTLAALVDAGVELAAIQAGIDSLGLSGMRLVANEVKRRGFRALSIQVEHEPEHAHRHLHHITDMIDASRLTERQKTLAKAIFQRLGEAEAYVHGTTLRKVHFHEVGAVDSIADVVGTAIGWDLLGVDQVFASPIPTGQGEIEIAHGRCSVPAPATARLLEGIPLAASAIMAELTTPTGAAIVTTLAQGFGPLPAMRIDRIGTGAGDRELAEQPNVLRLLIGESLTPSSSGSPTATASLPATESDAVWIVETNLDDTSGELIGYTTERLLTAGALDVYTQAIQMKKNRPATKLTLLCRSEQLAALEAILFNETTTLGLRRYLAERHTLHRHRHEVQTPFGPVSGKVSQTADGQQRFSPEFDDCRRVAEAAKVPLQRVYEAARQAFGS